MKKNNISIDFIAFGDLESETKRKLEAFNENVKGSEGSYLAIIPPGPNLLSDSIIATPILSTDSEGGAASGSAAADALDGGAGANGFDYGFDPETDPDMAMALRLSMEDEQDSGKSGRRRRVSHSWRGYRRRGSRCWIRTARRVGVSSLPWRMRKKMTIPVKWTLLSCVTEWEYLSFVPS